MTLSLFRGFTPIHSPCVFVSPSDGSILYPSSHLVVVEAPRGGQSFLTGLSCDISCLDVSSRGRMAAAGECGLRSDVCVWRLSDFSLIFRLSEHDGGVSFVSFSHDERLLATRGEEGRLVVWDMASGNIVSHKSLPDGSIAKWGGRVPDVKGRPTKTFFLATAGRNGVILHVVDPLGAINSESLPCGKYSRAVTTMQFTDQHLICGTSSSDFLVFELHSRTLVRVFNAGRNGVADMYAAPDGAILAGTGDGRVLAVSESGAQEIYNCGHPIAGIYDTHVLTRDGYLISNKMGLVWQCHSCPVRSIDCCGKVAVSAGADKTVKVWDNRNMECTLSFDSGFRSSPSCVSLSSHLLVVGDENGALRGFDFTNGENLFEISHCHHSAVTAAEIAPTRRFFATGGDDAAVRIWDVRTRSLFMHLKEHSMSITAVRFMPTASHIYTSSADMSVCLFDIDAEKMIQRLTQFASHVTDLDVTGDYLVAVTQDGHVEKFCISQTTQPIASVKSHETTSMAISPNGTKFAIGHVDGNVSIWDFESFRKLSETKVHSHEVSDIRFFQDNRVMASGIDGGIAVLSVE